jgi:cytoskeleton protein RodZ
MTDRSDFGGRLREAREARGIGLAQIAATTKISAFALAALERNDVSRLPGGIFSRAFVRAYAREVGLDPEKTVEEFVARFSEEGQAIPSDEPGRAPAASRVRVANSPPRSGLRWFGLGVSVLLIVLFVGIERYLNRSQGPQPASAGAGVQKPPSPPAATTVKPPTAEPGEPAAPPPAAPSSQTKAPATGGAQSAAPAAVPAATLAAAAATPTDAQAASLPLRVVVAPTTACWISAKVDGNRVQGRTVQAGERVALTAADEIVLTAGDAAAISYTINDAPGRPLGEAGKVVTIVINLRNYQSYIHRQ